jgi:hypothetical protein
MFEPAVGNGDGGWGEVYMPRNFCTLTVQTVLSIHPDVPSHTSPAKLAADQLYRCFHAWVCYVVQRGDGGVPEGGRNQGSEGTCGDVAEQFNSLYQLGGDEEGSAVAQLAAVFTVELCGRHCLVINRRWNVDFRR